jgi:hypothetical protein
MASTINATGSGVVITGDSSGALNLQVGGSNAIQISSGGATTISSLSTTGSTISSGNLAFTGTGQRITGDFSSSNPVYFQTSTVDGGTSVGTIPNGTGTTGFINLLGSSSGTDCNRASLQIYNGSEMSLRSVGNGTFTFVPMTFHTGGSERLRIDTSGRVGIGTASPGFRLSVQSVSGGVAAIVVAGESNTERIQIRSSAVTGGVPVTTLYASRGTQASPTTVQSGDFLGYYQIGGYDGSDWVRSSWIAGTAEETWSGTNRGSNLIFSTTPIASTAIAERFRIGPAGQLGIGGANYGNSGQVLTSTGASTAPSWQDPAGLPSMTIVSGTSQAAVANAHYVLTNASATTVTLPASPAAGAVVWVTVANGRVDNVIARNGQNINSLAENMTIDNAYAGVQLRYADATRGWVFT